MKIHTSRSYHIGWAAGGLLLSALWSGAGCVAAPDDPPASLPESEEDVSDPSTELPDVPSDELAVTNGTVTQPVIQPVPGEYIVVLNQGQSVDAAVSGFAAYGVRATSKFTIIPGFVARLDNSQLARLKGDSKVRYVEPNYIMRTSTVQNGARKGLDRIDQPTGNNGKYDDFGFDGTGTHIYIVDTGIRSTHQEFTGRIGNGFSAIGDTSEDCNGHGTHVASSAAGTVYGVAKKATIHAVRVLDCSGNGTTAGVISGLQWVQANKVVPAVANMSLTGGASQALDDAIAALVGANVTVVVAAGNFSWNACDFSPARAPAAVTVAATDQNDKRAGFSNYGTCVDIFAPGTDVIGANYTSDNATATLSGTSMASPHVAGGVALYLDRYPLLAVGKVTADVLSRATTGVVQDPAGSPNRFLYTNMGNPDPNSCYGYCGIGPASNCFCDPSCTYFNDCCADYAAVCK